jgi:hypothetical protein
MKCVGLSLSTELVERKHDMFKESFTLQLGKLGASLGSLAKAY